MPMTHSRVTVTVFQAKALYGQWTSEYAHYRHHIHSRGVIRYLAHDTSPYFVDALMDFVFDACFVFC